jgi:hypothetical protein
MQHGPYPLYHWISDYWWMGCLSSVLVFSLRMNAKRRVLFTVGSALLILSRVGLESGGGGYELFELPLLIAMDVYAIRYVIRPERFERRDRRDAPLNSRPSSQSPAPSEVRSAD